MSDTSHTTVAEVSGGGTASATHTVDADDRTSPMMNGVMVSTGDHQTVVSEVTLQPSSTLFRGSLYPSPKETEMVALGNEKKRIIRNKKSVNEIMSVCKRKVSSDHNISKQKNLVDETTGTLTDHDEQSNEDYPSASRAMTDSEEGPTTTMDELFELSASQIMPLPAASSETTQSRRQIPPPQQPGAFAAGAPGTDLQRLEQLNFSLVRIEPPLLGQEATMDLPDEYDTLTMSTHNHDHRNTTTSSIARGRNGEDHNGHPPAPPALLSVPATTGTAAATSHNDNNNNLLVEALPVREEDHNSDLMEAQPVQRDGLVHQAARNAKERQHKKLTCGFVMIVCLVLTVSLAVGLTIKKTKLNVMEDDETPTTDGTGPLPPMKHLELLYDDLPRKTKQSLININDSPQRKAWEWLQNHPNVTIYPEWRKKQIFSMAAFYYSSEGPSWPERIRNRWMDVKTSECSWVLSDNELAFFVQSSQKSGFNAQSLEDWLPCNEAGELINLIVFQLFLPTGVKASIPPEIGLLKSLKVMAFVFSRINAKLSDLLVPELHQLPNLEGLAFHGSGVFGTIPKELGLITGLRHLLLGGNALTGTIPPEISNLTSMEYFLLSDEEEVTGTLPTQLGLMTSLTGLVVFKSFVGGRIPSELGLINQITEVGFSANILSGSIPSEMGLWTNMEELWVRNNALTGSLPSEVGLMTNIIDLRLGNDMGFSGGGSVYNDFSGSFPSQLWKLSNLEKLHLPNLPNLRGNIPSQISMPNLTLLSLSGSPHLSGTIPDQACLFVDELDFDCSSLLCGCDCLCQ